jgi:uncharacterized LabA/DUF88 family protein
LKKKKETPSEMTDVNIATELLMDAFNDRFDLALVISGDSDLVPPILALKQKFTGKRVVVRPRRWSKNLGKKDAMF